MFDANSRYAAVETVRMTVSDNRDPDGEPRQIAYKRRRFIPGLEGTTPLVDHTVIEGDRLDNLAARYLGDPTELWRICDANIVLRPDELEGELGRSIHIALPAL
jgi:hypothetical protein